MKRRLLWIIELFIWLLLLLSISSGIMFAKYNYKKNFDTYQIFLPDVDGLIVGSPVKFMGIQIGYVNQLNITGEDIYVNFIITDTNVKVPYGATATVEFSGLGGSKSLELYPPIPGEVKPSKFIVTQPPKRIHDSLGLLNDMFEATVEIAYDVSHFMEKIGALKGGKVKEKRKKQIANSKQQINGNPSSFQSSSSSAKKSISFNELLDKCNNWLDKAQKQCDKFNKNVKKKKAGKNENHGKN